MGGRTVLSIHAHASATTIHTTLTLPWEVTGISLDRGYDIIWESIDCYLPANLAFPCRGSAIAVHDVP